MDVLNLIGGIVLWAAAGYIFLVALFCGMDKERDGEQ